jgi:hypothetical protein
MSFYIQQQAPHHRHLSSLVGGWNSSLDQTATQPVQVPSRHPRWPRHPPAHARTHLVLPSSCYLTIDEFPELKLPLDLLMYPPGRKRFLNASRKIAIQLSTLIQCHVLALARLLIAMRLPKPRHLLQQGPQPLLSSTHPSHLLLHLPTSDHP